MRPSFSPTPSREVRSKQTNVGSTPQRLLTPQNLIALGHEDLMLDYLKQICVESRSSGGAVEPPSVSGGCEVTQAAPALTFNDTSNFSSPVPHRRVSSLPLDAATPLRAVRVGTTIMEVHRHEKIRDATSAQHPETRPYPLSPAHDTLSRIRSENKHTTRPRSHSSWESPGFLYNNQGSLSEFRHPRHCVGYTFSKSRRSAPYVSQVVSSARTNFSHGGEGSHSLLVKELYGSKYSSSAATGGLQRPVASTFGLQRPNYLPHSSAAFLLSRGMEDRVNYDPIRLSGGADPHRITTREAIRRARAAVVSHRGRRPSRPTPSMDESKTGSPTETSMTSFPGPGQYTLPSVDITSKAPRTPSVRIHPSKAHPIAHDRPNTGHSSRHLETKLNREYGNSAPEASDDKSEIPTSLSKPSSAANSNADRTTFSKAIRDFRKLYIGQQFVQQPTYTSIEESPIAERPQYYSAPLDTILNPKTKSGTKFAPSDPTEGQKQNRFHMYYSGKDFRSNMLGTYSPGPAQYPSINTVSKRKNKHQ